MNINILFKWSFAFLFLVSCTVENTKTNPLPPIEISFEQPTSDAEPYLRITEYSQCADSICYEYILNTDGVYSVYEVGLTQSVASGLFERLNIDPIYIDHAGLVLMQDRLCQNFKTNIEIEYLITPKKITNTGPTQFTCTKSDEAKFLNNYGSVEDFLGLYYAMHYNAFRDLETDFKPTGKLVFQISETGGCARGGNRCEHHFIFDDGKFVTKRAGTELIIAYGQVEKILINNWLQTTDHKRLKKVIMTLGEGVCESCADGIDIGYWVYTPNGVITVNSLDKGFNDDDFFIRNRVIWQAMLGNSHPLMLAHPRWK